MLYPTYRTWGRDPFGLMRGMMQGFDGAAMARPGRGNFPAINIWQNAEAVAISAELPGSELSDIDITVQEDVLTIGGERKAPVTDEGARWHRRERTYGKFTRAIRLPFAADSDDVQARFTNGVLQIVVGRPERDKPRRIQINAG
jgi:HSP20 family protein